MRFKEILLRSWGEIWDTTFTLMYQVTTLKNIGGNDSLVMQTNYVGKFVNGFPEGKLSVYNQINQLIIDFVFDNKLSIIKLTSMWMFQDAYKF